MTEKRKSLPWPFNYAKLWYGVELQEDDIDYINNVIISKCIKEYRLIRQAHEINTSFIRTTNPENYDNPKIISIETGNLRDFVETGNADHFFEQFLDDKNCPPRVKFFLFKWIGNQRGAVKSNGMYDDYIQRSFLTELWFGTICLGTIPARKKHTMPVRKKNKKKRKPRIYGIIPGTSRPKLRKISGDMLTIYMFLKKRTCTR